MQILPPYTSTPLPRSRNNSLLLLALVLVFALAIRLWDIRRESFWADEGWTMLLIQGQNLHDVTVNMVNDQHPPLYFALLHYWVEAFGESETMIRLLSAFWSLIGIAAVFRLAADQFGAGAALTAALLLALADNDIMLSREARHYTQMATFAVLASLGYLRYLRRPARGRGIVWFASGVALMYTHYLGAFVLCIQLLHLFLFARPFRRLLDGLFRLAAIAAAWSPWVLVFINQSLVRYTNPRLYQSTLDNSPETFAIVRGDLVGSHYGLTVGLLILGLVYIAYRNGLPRLRWRPRVPTAYLALWVILPVVAIVALNPRFPILTTRNFLLVTPAILLLIGHGVMNLDRTARALVLAVLVIVGLFSVDAYHLKPPYREIATDIVSMREAAEPVLMDVWVDNMALRYHLGRINGTPPEVMPLVSLPDWRDLHQDGYFAYLLEYLRDKPAIWFAYWGQNQDKILEFFPSHGYQLVFQRVYLHRAERIMLYRYERPPQAALARFGDALRLARAGLVKGYLRAGTPLQVNLTWEALRLLDRDYSVSVFLLDKSTGQAVAPHDAPPLSGNTSGWPPETLHFDSHTLTPSVSGYYQVAVKVYWYGDQIPLAVQGADGQIGDFFIVGEIEVSAP